MVASKQCDCPSRKSKKRKTRQNGCKTLLPKKQVSGFFWDKKDESFPATTGSSAIPTRTNLGQRSYGWCLAPARRASFKLRPPGCTCKSCAEAQRHGVQLWSGGAHLHGDHLAALQVLARSRQPGPEATPQARALSALPSDASCSFIKNCRIIRCMLPGTQYCVPTPRCDTRVAPLPPLAGCCRG